MVNNLCENRFQRLTHYMQLPLREIYPYLEFSLFVVSQIWTESQYYVQMQVKTDQKTSNTATFHVV